MQLISQNAMFEWVISPRKKPWNLKLAKLTISMSTATAYYAGVPQSHLGIPVQDTVTKICYKTLAIHQATRIKAHLLIICHASFCLLSVNLERHGYKAIKSTM